MGNVFEDVGDFLFGDSDEANAANQQLIEQAMAGFDEMKLDALFKRARRDLRGGRQSARQAIQRSYAQSRQALAGASLAARRAAYRAQGQNIAQARAQLANRGLARTTAAPAAFRGIRDATAQRVSESESALAGARAALASQKGTALANVETGFAQNQASLLGNLARLRLGEAQGRASFLSQIQHQSQPGLIEGLGGGTGIAALATAFSDRRLKENIHRLNGYAYNFRGDSTPTGGVMADEVEAVVPDAVSVDRETGYKRVDYTMLIGVLLEAVKDLSVQVNSLEAELHERRFDL